MAVPPALTFTGSGAQQDGPWVSSITSFLPTRRSPALSLNEIE